MTIQKTRWSPDTCQCVYEYEWDDSTPPETRTHTLATIVNACPLHSVLADDTTKYTTVLEENQRKNATLQTVLDNAPSTAIYDLQADGITRTLKQTVNYNWNITGTAPNRVLNISFTGITLTTPQRNSIQTILNTKFGSGKVIIS